MKKNDSTDTRIHGTGSVKWLVEENNVDMTAEFPSPLAATIHTEKQKVTFDVRRAALIVIDMQNDFCAGGGLDRSEG